MSHDSDDLSLEELADGLALWEEHKPQGREDWLRIAKRWHVVNDAPPDNPSPLFGALYDAVSEINQLRDALGLLRGHVADDEGWRIINDALSLRDDRP